MPVPLPHYVMPNLPPLFDNKLSERMRKFNGEVQSLIEAKRLAKEALDAAEESFAKNEMPEEMLEAFAKLYDAARDALDAKRKEKP